MSDRVYVGNAGKDAALDRGWLLGHFKEVSDPRHSEDVEIKWGVHPRGDERARWVTGEERTALLVLVSGRFRVELPGRSVLLAEQGDYVVWGRGVDHSWFAEADSVVLTVRWPSVPGYQVNGGDEAGRRGGGRPPVVDRPKGGRGCPPEWDHTQEVPTMTDDAYIVLFDDPAVSLGVPLAAVEDAAFMDTPAVRAWLEAQGVTVTSPGLRLLPPEETSAVPEGAERLPVPLGDEELSRVRQLNAPYDVARMEEELLAYRSCAEGREALLARAVAAGVPAHRIAELTGEDLTTVKALVH